MNLSLPKKLKTKAVQQARLRHFSTTSDYLQHLIRSDVENIEQKKILETFLREGIKSGEAKNLTLDQLHTWMTQTIENTK